MTPSLNKSLAALVDPCVGANGDWSDVLERAGVHRQAAPKWRRRRALAVALVGLVLVAALASPAFGLRDSIVRWVSRVDVPFTASQPASSLVRRQFAGLSVGAPSGMDPKAIAGQARKALLTADGEPRAVWVAPTESGGFCYLIEGDTGGCMGNGGPAPPMVSLTLGSRGMPGQPSELTRISGTIHSAKVHLLTVEYADGDREVLQFVYVSAPVDAGFFFYKVPPERRGQAAAPVAVVAQDADGKIIHREPVDFRPLRSRLPATPPVPRTLPVLPRKRLSPPRRRARMARPISRENVSR